MPPLPRRNGTAVLGPAQGPLRHRQLRHRQPGARGAQPVQLRPRGHQRRQPIANDGHGNTANCTATVTVVDNAAPAAICKNATAYLNAGGTATITASTRSTTAAPTTAASPAWALPPPLHLCRHRRQPGDPDGYRRKRQLQQLLRHRHRGGQPAAHRGL
ncbi:MAG: hypothetical protein MRJ68_15925 [Nitrospira sp.]|nr:hypothetical protein [Nitrospira sp.]